MLRLAVFALCSLLIHPAFSDDENEKDGEEEINIEEISFEKIIKDGSLDQFKKKILAESISVNARVHKTVPMIIAAAEEGRFEIVEYLLKREAKVNVVDRTPGSVGRTALHVAAGRVDVELVELLLGYEADPKATGTLDEKKVGYGTVMELAVGTVPVGKRVEADELKARGKIITRLVQAGAKLNDKGSPFRYATQFSHSSIVKLLIDLGEDPNHTVRNSPVLSKPALFSAVGSQVYFSEPPKEGEKLSFQRAFQCGNPDTIQVLLDAKASKKATAGLSFQTPAFFAKSILTGLRENLQKRIYDNKAYPFSKDELEKMITSQERVVKLLE